MCPNVENSLDTRCCLSSGNAVAFRDIVLRSSSAANALTTQSPREEFSPRTHCLLGEEYTHKKNRNGERAIIASQCCVVNIVVVYGMFVVFVAAVELIAICIAPEL